jgi:hypothetical protein
MATETKIARVAFMDRGAYSAETEYNKWDFVTTVDSTYLYIGETPATGKPVTDTAYWKCIADGKQATAAAELANTARTELTTAVNTKLDEADGKIEEMNTTLSTYDGRVTQVESDIDQLAGEVNLLDAVQGAKIKDIENVLSTANLGQSAQLSVSGRKTVSLPKNAANGGMQVKLEGFTAENYLPNGDFRNGINGWINTNFDVVQSDGVLLQKNNDQGARFRQFSVANLNETDIYYAYAIIQCSVIPPAASIIFGQTNAALVVYDYFYTYASQNTDVQRLSLKGNIDLSGNYHTLGLSVKEAYQGNIKVKHMSIINLTETFGAGNEPDIATCDKIFSSYFEGRKNFEPTGRVRSVGKNLLKVENIGKGGLSLPGSVGEGRDLVTDLQIGDPIIATFSSGYSGLNSGYIPVKKNINIVQKCTSTPSVHGYRMAVYDEDYNILQVRNNSASINTGNGAYIVASLQVNYTGVVEFTDWQIEENSIPTTYEPYKETNLYLTAPELLSNGLVKDEIRKGSNGYELVKRISDVDGSVLTTPVITPISYGGILNSSENGTVYHEPIIADAGVYDTKMDILLTDYPIASIEEIIKYENGVDTYLNVASAVVASDGLSFTHPDLTDGDLVLFTYAFDKESTNGNITATFYDSNVVKIDTVTGKAYKIEDVVTNGVLTRTLTEV